MNRTDKTVKDTSKPLTRALDKWSAGKKKVVVGIDGYSGSGKTTILEWVAEHDIRVQPVYIDDFIFDPQKRWELMTQAKDKSMLVEQFWADFEVISKLVLTFRHSSDKSYGIRLPDGDIKYYDLSKPILILEGMFLFYQPLINSFLDKKVYIDLQKPTQVEVSPQSYYKQFEATYERYTKQYKPRSNADLVLTRN